MRIHFFPRDEDGPEHPGGVTVSKHSTLPARDDFRITEYTWGSVALWFVDADKFTADERQAAYESFMREAKP